MTADAPDWARLCELLDDDPELGPAVAAADPADRWEALIDGLDDAGALAYLEVGDSGMELADALAELPRVFRTDVELDEVGDVDDLVAAIARADALLSPHGLRLLRLEEDPTAVPIVAVPAEHVDEIISLAAARGRGARRCS